MNVKQATRRYYAVFVPVMLVFLASSLGIFWLDSVNAASDGVLAILAVIPIAAILSMFWIHWRYMQDIDEFLRQIQMKGMMVGAAVALGAGTAWGYLEMYADAPPISVFWINPLFWVAYAVATMIFSKREGGGVI